MQLQFVLALALMLGSNDPAHARLRPPSLPAHPNVEAIHELLTGTPVNARQIYAWSEGALYPVTSSPGRISDIALQPGEELVSVAAGDTARWIIGDTSSGSGPSKRTHLLIKPVAAGLTTNAMIATDRRTYHLILSSKAAGAMTAIAWTYPPGELLLAKRSVTDTPSNAPLPPALSGPDLLNFSYAITGDRPAWRPLRAFDDGRQTFIQFPATLGQGEAPPLFVIGSRGEAQLVNFRVRGRYYIVDRLFDRAELRLGEKKQQVVRISRTASDEPRS